MSRKLIIYLQEIPIGILEQDKHGALSYAYKESWLSNSSAIPISISLPLQTEIFKQRICQPFFAGLLPEAQSRTLLSKYFGISENNDFALLEKIGAECAGALSLRSSEITSTSSQANYKLLNEIDLFEKLETLPQNPLLAKEQKVRLSLAGAQSKMVVTLKDNNYYLPLNGAPSTHILKPQSKEFDNLIRNEFLCMQIAKQVGLDVAVSSIQKFGTQQVLQVTRFDRESTSNKINRLHQEDFCQALGYLPEMKYQAEGGPSLKSCFNLIRDYSSSPAVDILKFLDAIVYNFLIGNNDAHAKNFSLIYRGRQISLAPLYDLVCTQAYPELTDKMAMKIGSASNHAEVLSLHWKEFLKSIELAKPATIKRILSLTNKVSKSVLIWEQANPEDILFTAIILKNCKKMINFFEH